MTRYFVLFFVLIWCSTGYAVPRMALTAGTPCAACHTNLQGGGIRTEIGWGASLYNGALTMEDMGMSELEPETNVIGAGISAGVDIRFLSARLGRPVADISSGEVEAILPDRQFIPMQIQVHAAMDVTDWLTAYGSYNVDRSTFEGEICDPTYQGQACAEAALIFKPDSSLPSVRVGHIQPSIGVRHDDHTILIRGDAARPRQPIIPPNYAETGVELHYQPVYWMQANLGGFRSKNLSESIGDESVVGTNDIAGLGRLAFYPRLDELTNLTSWVGASFYTASDFYMLNNFIGVGWLDWGALFIESAHSWRGGQDYETENFMVGLEVTPKEWFVVHGRAERAITSTPTATKTDALVAGLKFYPVPFITLNPEYRIISTPEYTMGQITGQVHIFY